MFKQSNKTRANRSGLVASRAAALVACAAVAGLRLSGVADAADISWIGAAGTPLDFGTPANWAGGAVPDAPDNALINNGGIATVGTGFSRTVTDLRLGDAPAGSGALTVTDGTLNATGNMAFGSNTTGAGTLNMSGGTLNIGSGLNGDFSIGDDGAGTATISGGFINTQFAFVGKSTHGHGDVTQTGGTLAATRNLVMAELKPADTGAAQTPSSYTMSGGTITVGNEMYIGAHGPVTFNLSGDGFISVVGTLHIAASGSFSDPPGGTGTLNMSGGTINITGANAHFVVADHGDATFNFSGGAITTNFYNTGQNFEPGFSTRGVVNQTGGSATALFAWVVGEVSRSDNLYDLSGGSVTVVGVDALTPGDLNIAAEAGAKGTLKVRGTGAASIANSVLVGNGTVSSGTLIVADSGSLSLGNNGSGSSQLIVGNDGTGNLQISGGNISTDYVTLGQNPAALGTATQTGGRLTVRADMSVGETSTNANVYDISGGTLSANGIYVASSGNGTLKVGGTATVSAASVFASSSSGTVQVSGGSLVAPSFANNGLYTQSGGNASLGPISGTGQITSTGGTLTAASIAQGTLDISSNGSVAVAPDGTNAGLSVVGKLSIAGGGKLDLANNDMIIDYTSPDTPPDVRSLLASGLNGGQWNGPGINSSKAATSPNAGESGKTALGYGESAVVLGPSGGTFDGQNVDNSAVLVKYTYAGDSNLDGQVDVTDLGALATNWQTSSVWTGGDFNYDGFVDVTDLGILATNWQAGVGNPLGPGSLQQALASVGLQGSTVPEPTCATLLAVAAGIGLLRSRQRKPAARVH